jgi:hypothetical protein
VGKAQAIPVLEYALHLLELAVDARLHFGGDARPGHVHHHNVGLLGQRLHHFVDVRDKRVHALQVLDSESAHQSALLICTTRRPSIRGAQGSDGSGNRMRTWKQ